MLLFNDHYENHAPESIHDTSRANLKKYSKDIDASMAKEWTSWNDHHSFIPILRNNAENVIDARWLHKWNIVDGKQVINPVSALEDLRTNKGTM